jgi:aldose 1-epimerase
VKRPGSRIAVKTTGRWEMGADKLPTRRSESPGIDGDCAGLDVDHCYDGWDGIATLHDDVLSTTLRSNLRRVVVFTTPQRDIVAIEPVSHVNNAINLVAAGADGDALGLHTLQPGETLTAQMSIEVERA